MQASNFSYNPAGAINGTGSAQPLQSSQQLAAANDLGPMRDASQESLAAIERFNQAALQPGALTPCRLPPNFTYGDIQQVLREHPGAMIAFVNEHNQVTDMFRLGSDGQLIHTTPCGANDAMERTINDLNKIDSRLRSLRNANDSALTLNPEQDIPLNNVSPTVYKPMATRAKPSASTEAVQQQALHPMQQSAVVHPLHTARQHPASMAARALQQQALGAYQRSQHAVHEFCKNALTNSNHANKLSLPLLGGLSTEWGQATYAYGAGSVAGGNHPTKNNIHVAIQGASRADLEKYRKNLTENLTALQEKIDDIRASHSKNFIEKGTVAPPDEVHTANMLCEWHNQLAAMGRQIDIQLSQKVEKPTWLDKFLSFFS